VRDKSPLMSMILKALLKYNPVNVKNEPKSNIHGISESGVIGAYPLLNARRPTIEACRSQGIDAFLSLFPR
jgi:hypothetical protein